MIMEAPKVEMTHPTSSVPDWVQGMFEHFHSTGAYRAEDIQRVLGDPREGVVLQAAPHIEMCYRSAAAS
jgi:hypothetical protein